MFHQIGHRMRGHNGNRANIDRRREARKALPPGY